MKWIPVKELPPKFKNVLAISKKGVMAITCVDSSGKIDNFQLEVDGKDYYTHWMPLPPAPGKSPSLSSAEEAIGFAEWLSENDAEALGKDHWRFRQNTTHTTAQLFKIYKLSKK